MTMNAVASNSDVFPAITRSRALFLALTLAYVGVFTWTYVVFTYDRFAYLGFDYRDDAGSGHYLRYTVFSLLPALWMPLSFERPSRLFLFAQFFLVYIPAQWMIAHAGLPVLRFHEQTQLSVALLAGMLLLVWALRSWPLLRIPRIRVPERLVWSAIYIGAAGCLVLLAILFRDKFQLVGLADIYAVRYAASDIIEETGSRAGGYAFTWLINLFLPLLFARALARVNVLTMAAVVGAYVFLFGIWGSKLALFGPVLLLGARVFAALPVTRMPGLFVLALLAALLLPLALPFEDGLAGLAKAFWIGIVHMRTFAVPGLAFVQYVGFFDEHARTLGSHISGLNLLLSYPYDYDIPRTVGYHFYGDLMTANANFWAQDGIAGFGLVGLLTMSVIAAGALWLLDSVTYHLSRRFVITALAGILITFVNVSLFTTLLTGGLGLFMLTCLFLPPDRTAGRHVSLPFDRRTARPLPGPTTA